MKLVLILNTIFVFALSANTYSQKSFTLNLNDVTVKDVIKTLEACSNYRFFYNDELSDISRKVDVNYNQLTIDGILSSLFDNTGLSYKILENNLIIIAPETSIQQKRISGTVSDATSSEPIIGANIIIEGTTMGTTTDVYGKFSIDVPGSDATLIISFIGYNSERITLAGQATLDVTLIPDIKNLDEIIVVGYGTQSKRNVTGSIQSVNANELSDMPVTTVAQKLQGKLSGVQINQTTGKPGQGMQVRVRGQGSITAGNDPLYVVDGFPITGDISSINPNEIESISVLKDAASTSLYGSRAANGVILITTRQAKAGKTQIGANVYYGCQTIPQKGRPDMMNGTEFAQFKKESYEDKGLAVPEAFQNPSQYGAGFDWYDAMLRVAPIQDYSLSLSTGKDNFSTSAVAGYFKQDGVLINSDYTRFSLRLNSDYKVSNKIRTGFNVAPTYAVNNTPSTDGIFWMSGLLSNALQTWPILPYKNADGTLPLSAWVPGLSSFPSPNYYRAAQEITNNTKSSRILSNGFITYEPLKGLVLKSTINFDYGQTKYTFVNPSTSSTSFAVLPPVTSRARFRNTQYYSWLNENTITYKKTIADHNFELLGGYTVQQFRNDLDQITVTGFPDDRIPTIASAANIDRSGTNNTYNDIQEWSLTSYLARLNYNFKNRYLLTAAIRTDGSSRFGSDNKWGTFPSISVGWIVSEESFMPKISALSLFKFRAGYGIVGNNNIGNYTQYATVSPNNNAIFGSSLGSGVAVTSLSNNSLTWEQTKEFDFGADIGLFDNRINASYDYYNKRTKSLLYSVNVAQESGFSSFMGNIGELKFWGHEISIFSRNFVGEFKWNTDFNISFTDNRVIALTGDVDRIYGDGTITRVGHRIGQFYGMIVDGVYKDQADYDISPKAVASEVGTIKFKDVNGDKAITNGDDHDDRTVIGDPTPKFIYGISNSFSYKNFDLSVIMSGSYGNDIANRLEQGLTNLDGVFNVLKEVKNRWRSPENPGEGKYGKTSSGTGNERDWFNSRFISNASFLSIKNVTIGYTIPSGKLKLVNSLRIYASVQQLYTFTNYKGANPEASIDNGGNSTSVLSMGNDYGTYPVPRTISFGINLGL